MNKRIRHFILNVLSLAKITIMLPVALSAFTGYFVYDSSITNNLLLVVTGVLLMAVAASALNQVQEIRTDRLMDRTSKRPLVTKELSVFTAFIIIIFSLLTGSALVYAGGGLFSLFTALATIAWYNGVYTLLKRISAFAVIPGALTGALPPVIGYLGAGGSLNNAGILALSFTFFMAQIPHFWLIQIRYGEEYKKAGLPYLGAIFDQNSISRLTFIWVTASIVSVVLLPLFRIIASDILIYLLIIISCFVFILFINRLLKWILLSEKDYFNLFNVYYLFIMLLVIADKLLFSSG